MRPFLSLPAKIVVLTLSSLLLMSAVLTSVTLIRLEDDFTKQQQITQRQRIQQFDHLNNALENQLRSWLESFAELAKLRQQQDFSEFANQLNSHYDSMTVHLNVENLWLLDDQLNLTYATAKTLPDRLLQLAQQVLTEQRPQSEMYCRSYCVKLLLLPLQNANGDLAVVAASTTLLDVLSAMRQSTGSDIAVVQYDPQRRPPQSALNLLSTSNADSMRSLFAVLPANLSMTDLVEQGIRLEHNQRTFRLMVLPLQVSELSYYLALADDVTPFERAMAAHRWQIIGVGLVVFLLLAVIIYILIFRLGYRLQRLSRFLPLLAQRQFQQFRERSYSQPWLFSDDIDTLQTAAIALSHELERLHHQVERNTQELENIAMFDLLTGLPNRNMLQYHLKKQLSAMERQSATVSLLFLDLDDFKKINDSLGHASGDLLLTEAANRLRLCIRGADMACRFGGDEFVVVLSGHQHHDYPFQVAQRIFDSFKAPVWLEQQQYFMTTSIGIAMTSHAQTTPDELIRQADMAMYEAKEQGGNRVQQYSEQMQQRLAQRLLLEQELKQAVAMGQFCIYLQPQFALHDGRLTGLEALLRWQHPERGMVAPDDFIAVLESSAQMNDVGYWVIRRCFALAKQLQVAGHDGVRLAINLSAEQFADPQLPALLAQWLLEFGVTATQFEFELTERSLVKNVEATLSLMNKLKDMGFHFAIDDFGTGYSSLSYLTQMPVDTIKIDKSFLFGMLDNSADYQVIISTIAMVHNLQLKVVAEGVESRAQLMMLKKHHCDAAQGYYFARPLSEPALWSFLAQKIQDGKLLTFDE